MDKEQSQSQSMMNYARQDTVKQQQLNYYEMAVCSEGNKCNQLCGTKQCKANAIVCADRRCKCYEMHHYQKICVFVPPQLIMKKIVQKRTKTPQFFNFIDVALQKLIDQISQFRDKLEKQVQNFRLADNMKEFLQVSKKMQFKQLTGQAVSKVLQQLNKWKKDQKQYFSKNLQKELEYKWNTIEEPIKKQLYSIENVIDQFLNSGTLKQSFFDSKVLSNQEQRKRLVQFFPQNKRKFQSKLIYRASENQFSIQSFHQKCDEISHTVTLVKTQFNKVIGGYTPLTWKGKTVENGTGEQDKSKESFVFSVTNNDKFTINPKSKSQICHYKAYGPVFRGDGGNDLLIHDKATDSIANIGHGYINRKYRAGDAASWQLFTGQSNRTYKFKILEWQVYQLNF